MAREAKIYFHDDLAGYLIETDHGYSFSYDKNYPRDRFALLINLCRDTIGAVSVYPMEAENDG